MTAVATPAISNVEIPNVSMKIGDVVTAKITVANDGGEVFSLYAGTIAGYALSNLVRVNATTYRAQFTIPSGGTDLSGPDDDIEVYLILSNSLNNRNTAYTESIVQFGDTINAHAPTTPVLSHASVLTTSGANALVGFVSATDATPNETISYAFVSGTGDTDNARFSLDYETLRMNDPAALGAGSYSIRVSAIDSAGNSSVQTFTITVESGNPSVSSIVRANGASSTVSAFMPSVAYTVTFSEATTGVDVDDFVLSGAGGGTISRVDNIDGIHYTVTVDNLTGDGTLRLDLKASGTGIVNSGSSPILGGYTAGETYTLDHTPPATPAAPVLAAGSDTGVSNSDGITSDTMPVLSGTAFPGGTVMLYDTDGSTPLGSGVADSITGAYTITLMGPLSAGTHTMSVTSSDMVGNVSAASPGITVEIDTTAPDTLALSASRAAVADATTGAALATLSANDSHAVTYSLVAGSNGDDASNSLFIIDGATLKPVGSLAAGTYNLYARATDAAGNHTEQALTFTVFSGPTVTSIVRADSAATLAAADATSLTYTVTFSELVTGVTPNDFTVVRTGTATGNIVEVEYHDGVYYTVTIEDLGGDGTIGLNLKTSGTGIKNAATEDLIGGYTGQILTLDHTPYSAPGTPAMTAGTDTGVSSSDAITSDATPTFTGTGEANATIKLYDTGGVLIGSTTSGNTGDWSITSSTLIDGAHSVTAVQLDEAGNVSAASGALAVRIDTTAPAAPAIPQLDDKSDTGAAGDNLTSVVTPTITGTGEANATIKLYDTGGTTLLGTTTANNLGQWSITSSTLTHGTHTLTVKQTDVAGNVSDPGAALSLDIDTSTPIAPSAPALAVASDSGETGDNRTNITTPHFNGIGTIGDTVKLYDGTTELGSAVVNGAGKWTITSLALAEGSHTLSVKQTNPAGTTSAASTNLSLVIDTTAPAAPSTPAMTTATDTGSSQSDAITSNTTPVFTGTGEANASVTLYDTDEITVLGTATVDNTSHWSITNATLTPGTHHVTVKQVDLAGNVSDASAALIVDIDTSAPAAPGAPVLSGGSDSGVAGDNLTSVVTPVITGMADANATVKLYDTDGTTELGSTTANGSGAWSITSTALIHGTHNLTAKQLDVAGNVSDASAPLSLEIDTSTPIVPGAAVLAAASDSGTAGDNRTNITTPQFTGTGTIGDTVKLYDDSGTTELGSAVVNGSGDWTITSLKLAEGSHTLSVKQTNPAGTTSDASATLVIDIDTTAPGAPGTPSMTAGTDTGASSSDAITKNTTPVFTGTGEIGATVELYDTVGGTPLGSAVGDKNGNWSITSSKLDDGKHQLTVKQTDAAGNVSGASAALTVEIDTAAPGAPATPQLAAKSDTGVAGDNLTNATTPTITGMAEANATVKLYDTDLTTLLGTTTANGSGEWSITSSTLVHGTHSLTVKQTDVAGNVSGISAALSLDVDTSTPVAPGAAVLAAASDSGTSGDNRTNVTTPQFTGTGTIGDTVKLYDDKGTTELGSAVVNGSGNWTITSLALAEGSHTLSVKQTNPAGTTSDASTDLILEIDITAPAAPSTPAMTTATDTGRSQLDAITGNATPVFTGTGESNATVILYDDSGTTELGRTKANISGEWTITSVKLDDGQHQLTVKQLDAAGNESAASAALTVEIDTLAPVAPTALTLSAKTDTGVAGDNLTANTAPDIGGTAEPFARVTLYDTDGTTELGITTADKSGNWIITSAALSENGHELTAKQLDVAGNVSGASTVLHLTIDTKAPAAAAAPLLAAKSDSGVAGDLLTNVTTPVITGTAEANATVKLYDTDGITELGSVKADGEGAWSVATTKLIDGPHVLTIKQVDAAGNVSDASAALTLTIDTSVPATLATPVLAPASDSGVLDDHITNVKAPVFSGTGVVGDLVTLYDTDGTTVLGTAEVNGGGTWSITSANLIDGVHTITATQTNPAGTASLASAAFSLTVDATAPSAPAALTLSASSDSGTRGDGITRVAVPVITGTAEANATVKLYDSDGSTVLGTATADGAGNWSITSLNLTDGTHQLSAKQTDAAGNVSPASAVLALTIDTSAPAAPGAPALVAASDSGAAGDGITNVAAPAFTGTGTPGRTVSLYENGTVLGTGVVDNAGKWTIASGTLAAGTHSLTARESNAAGTESGDSAGFAVTITATSPAAPSAPVLDSASDSGVKGDRVTNITTPTVTGSAAAGATVKLYDTNGTTLLGSATADASGHWSIATSTLAGGAHTLKATQTDIAGNVSPLGAALALTIDTAVPNAPSAMSLTAATDSGTRGDGITNSAAPALTGTGTVGATVTVYDGATALGSAVVGASARWTISATGLAEGNHSLTAVQSNAAGTASAASAAFALTIDRSAPTAISLSNASVLNNAAANAVVGALANNDSADHGQFNYTLAAGAGDSANSAFTVAGGELRLTDPSHTAAGTYSVRVQATDAAGNSYQQALSVTVKNAVSTVDGVPVQTAPVTLPGGGAGNAVTVPVVEAGRTDSGGAPQTADITLASAGGADALVAHVPVGVGLTSTGGASQEANTSLASLSAAILARTADSPAADQAQLTANGQDFLSQLSGTQSLLLNTVVLSGAGNASGGEALVLSGTANSGLQTALVIDTTGLTAAGGGQVTLENVAFAAVIGQATVSGTTNGQVLAGDGSAQHFVVGGVASTLVRSGGGDDVLELSAAAAPTTRAVQGAQGGLVTPGALLLNGGTGADTVILGRDQADYTVVRSDGHLVVTDKVSGVAATLVNVEAIQFADATVQLDSRAELGKIAALYQNVLGRQADVSGFEFWGGNQGAHSASLGEIAVAILGSSESTARGNVVQGDAAHDVALLYQALFGRAADTAGAAFWVDAMRHGSTLTQVADAMLASAEMTTHVVAATAWDLHF